MNKSIKILVVEDDSVQAQLLSTFLNKLNYEVKIAETGNKGVEITKSWLPNLVLLDLYLPDITGLLVAQQISEDDKTFNIPIIMISSDFEEETVVIALSSGILDFIQKPIRNAELSIRINNILQLKYQQKQLEVLTANLEKEKNILAKYFSHDFVEQVLSETISPELGGAHVEASIMFFDIRKSTTIAEKLEPDVFVRFLSEMFTDIMDLIYGNHGSVNKMLGDGILATFGPPIATKDDTLNAIRTVIQIRDYISQFNEFRPEFLEDPINVGMGIATGKIFAGNVGSVRRMEYAVLGDPVNTAARLEALTKEAKVSILIDGNTRHALGKKIKVRKVKYNKVRGRMSEMEIFSLEELNE